MNQGKSLWERWLTLFKGSETSNASNDSSSLRPSVASGSLSDEPRGRLTELQEYRGVLPYDSELFGVYQPLIGWTSKRIFDRFSRGLDNDKWVMLERMFKRLEAHAIPEYESEQQVVLEDVDWKPAEPRAEPPMLLGSILIEKLSSWLTEGYSHEIDPAELDIALQTDNLQTLFNERVKVVYKEYFDYFSATLTDEKRKESLRTSLEERLNRESQLAGLLQQLKKAGEVKAILGLLRAEARPTTFAEQAGVLAASDTPGYLDFDNLDPRNPDDLKRAALSPISVVHLFRQYFFELDSFLGSPVGHVWLSPGSTVELIEVNTRRTLTERTVEQSIETINRTESETVSEEEISDAVKDDNRQDIQFGASVTASYASIDATSTFDSKESQQRAREETHKLMRRQSDKVSSEIRKNFKTTFRTVTETTDTSNKRYVLANTGKELINYELRRKMRQVAVQVQDVGSYLCWQTYVDEPGAGLGVAKLLHIGVPADLEGLHAPSELPMPQPFIEKKTITIPFISVDGTDADNKNEVYRDGIEVDDSEWFGNLEKIKADFPCSFASSKVDYELKQVEFDSQRVQKSSKCGVVELK